jgi:hypothetical protein
LIDRFASIMAATGDLFTAKHGYPLVELLERDVVVELEGLKTDHQDFIIEFLLTWTFRYRQARQRRGSGVEHAFVLDEGKRAFSVFKEQDRTQGIPQINYLTAEMREFGEALLVGDQEPNKLTDALHSNTGTTALFRLEEGEQFRRMVRSMQLSDRQQVFADQLETGQAIVKHGGGSAVPVQFPESGIEKTVTDEQLADDLRPVWNQLSSSTTDGADEASSTETGEEGGDRADGALSDRARALLDDVAAHPYRKMTEHYDALGMSRYSGNKAKKTLVGRRLVEPYEIRKKYGRPTILGLTDDGRSYLQQRGVSVERDGRGGPRHRYWQHFLHGLFCDAGFDAVVEADDADIAVTVGSARVAVEIAMAAANREVDHIHDRFANGFDRVVVGCRNVRVRADLLRKLQVEGFAGDDRVTVLLLRRLQSEFEDAL